MFKISFLRRLLRTRLNYSEYLEFCFVLLLSSCVGVGMENPRNGGELGGIEGL